MTMSKKARAERWVTPLAIPEREIDGVRIEHEVHEAGWCTRLASARTAIFQGDKRGSVEFPFPTRWHRLVESGRGVWTTDLPIERMQQERDVVGFRGDVLCSGLGVGLIAVLLAKRLTVRSVTVVERSPAVVRLVQPHLGVLGLKVRVLTADVFDYLQRTDDRFDYVFHDIWQGDGLHTLRHTVVPLKRLSRRVLKNPRRDWERVRNWNEGCMMGQLGTQLWMRHEFIYRDGAAKMDAATAEHFGPMPKHLLDEPALCLTAPYWRWWHAAQPDEFRARRMLQTYTWAFGSSLWGERFGELLHCDRIIEED